MITAYLFEFMDLGWLPVSLRLTMRDILECVDSKPFRNYFSWVTGHAKDAMAKSGLRTVVELGAGSAPLSRHLAATPLPEGTTIVTSDITPDRETYQALEKSYPGLIKPCYESVDFSKTHDWGPDALLLLSGTFHHLPFAIRADVLKALTNSGRTVMVFEPLRKNILSLLLVFCSLIPSLILPLWYLGRRPGTLRRVVWCWLLPVAPLMFCWDGVASIMRYWSEKEWLDQVRSAAGPDRPARAEHSLFSTMIAW